MSDEVFLTFAESRRVCAIQYLTRVLTATGGERQAAAKMAGVTRTHMQQLVRKYAIPIAANPKARGRRRSV